VFIPTLTSLGKFFHHDGMYARKRLLSLYVYSMGWTLLIQQELAKVKKGIGNSSTIPKERLESPQNNPKPA
jgi:hypothetical protein